MRIQRTAQGPVADLLPIMGVVFTAFLITGAQSWGLTLAGPQNTGKVLAWMGTAMYAAFALGAPAGTALYTSYGFFSIALATMLLPLAILPLVVRLRRVAPTARVRPV